MAFDPSQYGAVPTSSFDPSKFGATPVATQNKMVLPRFDEIAEEEIDKPSMLSKLTSPGLFKASEDDSGIEAGAKTLGNVIPSALGFVKNVFKQLNPVTTFKTAQEIGE